MAELSDVTDEIIRREIDEFIERPEERARNIALFARVRPLLQKVAVAVIDGEHQDAGRLTRQVLDEGIVAPEVLSCARAMKAGMAHIEPILTESGVEPMGTVIMGTVKGDLHDIGKN